MQVELIVGNTYTIEIVHTEANRRKIKSRKKMKLVGTYKNHAQFMDKLGIRQSFSYWELNKILIEDNKKNK